MIPSAPPLVQNTHAKIITINNPIQEKINPTKATVEEDVIVFSIPENSW